MGLNVPGFDALKFTVTTRENLLLTLSAKIVRGVPKNHIKLYIQLCIPFEIIKNL